MSHVFAHAYFDAAPPTFWTTIRHCANTVLAHSESLKETQGHILKQAIESEMVEYAIFHHRSVYNYVYADEVGLFND